MAGEIGLGAFRRALNMRADGSFATSIEKTKGNLYVDGKGVLKSANRHFNTVRTDPTANARARSQLLSALESASPGVKSGAQLEFLERVRAQLGLAGNRELSGQPLSRRDVKQIITEFDAIVRNVPNEGKMRATLAKAVDRLGNIPKDWVITAPADWKVDFEPPGAGAAPTPDLNRRLAKLLLEVLHLSDSNKDVAKKAAELLGLANNDARPVPPITVDTILKLKALPQRMSAIKEKEALAAANNKDAKQALKDAFGTIMLRGKNPPEFDARDMDRYETFLKEREGDSIGALYDLMREKGVTDDCLKARYDYPNVNKNAQPRNRKEELDPEKKFQSKAMEAWQVENNIDDGPLRIDALEETARPKPAEWVATAAECLRNCENLRTQFHILKQQNEAPIPEDAPQPPPAPDNNIVNDDNNIINENW